MKLNIGVIFGGASVEHEISVISGNQVIHALNKEKYNVIPIYISKEQDFYYAEEYREIEVFKDLEKAKKQGTRIILKKDQNKVEMHHFKNKLFNSKISEVDIFFPVLHGTNGEDGTVHGMLEVLEATFVGCDLKGAVSGQDKVFTKNILKDNKVNVVDYLWFYVDEYFVDEQEMLAQVESELAYPLIVKPASLGSSVGINKANNKEELKKAIEDALKYDIKVVVEKAIDNLCEVNIAILGDYSTQRVSAIEEVFQSDEILSYQDKYQSNGSKSEEKGMAATNRQIPAQISDSLSQQVQDMAIAGFKALNLAGNVRVDFLINKGTEQVYLNEFNTIPGSLAFYLWDAVDLDFENLCEELLKIAIKRQREKKQHLTTFDTNVLESFEGTKGGKGKR